MSLFSRLFSRSAQKSYHRGMDAYNRGDYEAAIECLEQVLASASTNSPIYVLSRFYVTHGRVHLGLAYLEARRYEDAHATFLEVVKRNPEYPDVHFHLGEIAERRDLWREAEMRYKRALLINPGYRDPRLALAILYRSRQRYADAAEHAKTLSESGLELPDSWLQGTEGEPEPERVDALRSEVHSPRGNAELLAEGMRFHAEGRLDDALESFTRSVETAPDHPDVRCLRATVLGELGRYAESIDELTRALEQNPGYLEARLKRGVAAFQLERYEDAAADFAILCEHEPDNPEKRLLLGMALFKGDRIKSAIDELSEAAASGSTAGRAHYFLALGYVALERRDRAISCLQNAKLPKCRALLGRLYLETNQNELAVEALEDAISRGADSDGVLISLARALYQAGRVEEAREKARLALEEESTANAGSLLLARMAFDAGEDEEAIRALDRVGSTTSQAYEARVLRGRVLGRMDRFDDAEAALQSALELRPDGEEARRALGLLYRRARKTEADGMLRGATADPADALFKTDEIPKIDSPWKLAG